MLRSTMTLSIWQFSAALYEHPSVASICLRLQDEWNVDVSFLLFGAWIGARSGSRLTPEVVAETNQVVQQWHNEIVRPLRMLRRRLKSGPYPSPSKETELLRTKLKRVEIESERLELEVLGNIGQSDVQELGEERENVITENLVTITKHFAGRSVSDEIFRELRLVAAAAARF